MVTHEEIMEKIQTIAGIFVQKGISVMPVSQDYMGAKLAPDMEMLVMKELILDLHDTLKLYERENEAPHKYAGFAKRFRDCLINNSDKGILISKKTA